MDKGQFIREDKYLVLKLEDIEMLPDYWRGQFDIALSLILLGRGKPPGRYVVVNEDEPYAEHVWALIEEHWEGKGGE